MSNHLLLGYFWEHPSIPGIYDGYIVKFNQFMTGVALSAHQPQHVATFTHLLPLVQKP